MNPRTFYIFLIVLMIVPFVSAAPPVLSTVQSGSLEIITPGWDFIKMNQNVDFYWHVFNSTTMLTNTTTSCVFHLYSIANNGEHIVVVNPVKDYGLDEKRDFEVEVKGANFSVPGDYTYLIECNTSTQTGGLEAGFTVTSNGYAPMNTGTAFNLWMILGIIFLTAISFFIVAYMMNNQIIKTILIGLGCLVFAMLVFSGMTMTQDIFLNYNGNSHITTIYYYFFWFMAITMTMTVLATCAWITFYAIKKLQNKRMSIDND